MAGNAGTGWTRRQQALFTAGAGVVTVLAFGVTAAALFSAPPVSADGSEVVEWLQRDKAVILVGLQAFGVSSMAIFAFFAGLRACTGSGELATLASVSGMLIFVVAWVGMVPLATMVWMALTGDAALTADTAHLLHALVSLSINMTGLPTAISGALTLCYALHKAPPGGAAAVL